MFTLARRYDIELLMCRASQIDAGFDRAVLASMLGSLERFTDGEIPLSGDVIAELRAFFERWRDRLRGEQPSAVPDEH